MKSSRSYRSRVITLLLVMYLSGTSFSLTASAAEDSYVIGNGSKVYQFDQLLSAYKSTSAEYRHSMLNFEISRFDSVLAQENYSSINYQCSNTMDKRTQLLATQKLYQDYLTTATDPTEIAEINSELGTIAEQLTQYDTNIASLQVSKAEADLQQQVEQFYSDDMQLLKKEAENKLSNEFLKRTYKLILTQKQQAYYEAYQRYLDTQVKVDKIKYNYGLISQAAYDASTGNLQKSTLDVKQNNDTFQSALSSLQGETGTDSYTRIVLPLTVVKKDYNVNQLISTFESNNTSLLQLAQLKTCYQHYQNANAGTYSLYQQIGLKVQDYQLQYDALKADIDTFVKDAVIAYQKACEDYGLASDQMKTEQELYNMTCVKRSHKKATQLDEEKAEYEMNVAIVSYYQSIYNIIIWQNILDSNVYGGTP